MATVPLQQTPTEQIETGGTPLFSPTNIQPVQDTGVAEDIGRLSKAQKQFAEIALQLQDEQNDIKSNEAYRGYQAEADVKVNEYLNLQRGDAIATVNTDEDGNTITAYDQLIIDLDEIAGRYRESLDNSNQIDIFNDKFSASKRISVNAASKHSLKQSRIKLNEESKASINLAKAHAIANFESWNDPEGDYRIAHLAGIAEIKRNAVLNGRNIDPEKGPLSSVYLEDLREYNKEIMEGVVDRLKKLEGGDTLALNFVNAHKPEGIKGRATLLELDIVENFENHNDEKVCDAILNANGNQNSGNYQDIIRSLLCLKSNHYVNDGTGASVRDGLHSDKVNTAEQTQENNIDTLERIKNESKFYKLDSNATLIKEHQPTHIFAVQHLGVQKADSLYTKAKSSIEIDQEKFKNDPKYAIEINTKIIDNYNDLIVEEANKQYRPEINSLKNKIKKLQNTPNISTPTIGQFGTIPGSKAYTAEATDLKNKLTLKKLKEELAAAEAANFKFVETLANDLEIIKKDINYDDFFKSDVDFITGLRPLEVLKSKVKETITDPVQQKYALKDLEIKYKKISSVRTKIYNEALNDAKEIAFAEEGGWKNLEANGIDINNFTEADQELLKKGQPKESDIDTIIKLRDNPEEIVTNLNSYSQSISQLDYLELKNYAKKLTEKKVIAVKIDNKLLNLKLKQRKFDDIISNSKDATEEAKNNYLELQIEWERLIDLEQQSVNKTISRDKKIELLDRMLDDTVFTGEKTDKILGIWGGKDVTQPRSTLTLDPKDDAYVKVGDEEIMLSSINSYMRAKIQEWLGSKGKEPTAQAIAEWWVKSGKPTVKNDTDYTIWNRNKMNSLQK